MTRNIVFRAMQDLMGVDRGVANSLRHAGEPIRNSYSAAPLDGRAAKFKLDNVTTAARAHARAHVRTRSQSAAPRPRATACLAQTPAAPAHSAAPRRSASLCCQRFEKTSNHGLCVTLCGAEPHARVHSLCAPITRALAKDSLFDYLGSMPL